MGSSQIGDSILDSFSCENYLDVLRRHRELALCYLDLLAGGLSGYLQGVDISVLFLIFNGHFLAEVVRVGSLIGNGYCKRVCALVNDLIADHCKGAVNGNFTVGHLECISIERILNGGEFNCGCLLGLVVDICYSECAASLRDILITLAGGYGYSNYIAGPCLVDDLDPAVLVVLGLGCVVGDGVFSCGGDEFQRTVSIYISDDVFACAVFGGVVLCELNLAISGHIIHRVNLISACRSYVYSKALAVVYGVRNIDSLDCFRSVAGYLELGNTAGVSYGNIAADILRNCKGISVLGFCCLDGLTSYYIVYYIYGIAFLGGGLQGNYIACVNMLSVCVFSVVGANYGYLCAGHICVVRNSEGECL